MEAKELEKAKDILIDLYINLKVRKADDVNYISFNNKYQIGQISDNSIEEERLCLSNLSILTLVQYINNSIDVIVNIKTEIALAKEMESKENQEFSPNEKWEALLRKEESNIRKYISNTHKLKLCLEHMDEKFFSLEKKYKNREGELNNFNKLKEKLNKYKNKIKDLNQQIEEFKEREKKLINEKKMIMNKLKRKKGDDISKNNDADNLSSSMTPNQFKDKVKVPSLEKTINNINQNIVQKLSSQRKKNFQKSLNTKSSSTRMNEEGKTTTLDIEKYPTIIFNKNNSVISNHIKKNRNVRDAIINSSYLNSTQLFMIRNNKLNDKIDVYKKLLRRKLKNKSRQKNSSNDFRSLKNNSIANSTVRTKKSFHSHSLENVLYSNKKKVDMPKNLKGFTIKVIQGRNKSRYINVQNSTSCMMQKIFDKNKELLSLKNIHTKKKDILGNVKQNN